MKSILLVFLGGGLGSSLRYVISQVVPKSEQGFPWGTFMANAIGCFLIGLLLAYFMKNVDMASNGKLLAIVGFCGGFTTMSSFSAESLQLLRDGQMKLFFLYVIGTLLLCFMLTILGLQLGK